MRADLKGWSLVLTGKWNTAILSPRWISEKLFKQESITVMFPVMGDVPPRYQSDNIQIMVAANRVEFLPLKDDDTLLNKIESAARFILTTLKHTPVAAAGQNFQYHLPASEAAGALAGVFDSVATSQPLKSEVIKQTSIEWRLKLSACVLNLRVQRSEDYHVALNYHYAVDSAKQAADNIKETFVANRNHGINLLKDEWDLALEEATDEED